MQQPTEVIIDNRDGDGQMYIGLKWEDGLITFKRDEHNKPMPIQKELPLSAAPQEGQQAKPQSKVGQYISCQTCHKPAGDQQTKDSGTCQECTGRIIREGRQREANRANLRSHLAANS